MSRSFGRAAGTPPRLDFEVLRADVDPTAATPSIALAVRVSGPPDVPIRSVMMRAQVRINPHRRAYDDESRERLREAFGAGQWGEPLRSVLWTQAVVMVPAFTTKITVTVPLPCTYDFEVAAAKVLQGLRDGVAPLELLFSGTLFYVGPDGSLRTAMVPWDGGIRFDLPVDLWRRAIDRFFPSSAWLRLDRDLFDRLYGYRSRRSLPSWDTTITSLLERAEEPEDE